MSPAAVRLLHNSFLRAILCLFCVGLEESPNFVTLDEVEEEEEKITPRTRGRPRKRTKKPPGNTSVAINDTFIYQKLFFVK